MLCVFLCHQKQISPGTVYHTNTHKYVVHTLAQAAHRFNRKSDRNLLKYDRTRFLFCMNYISHWALEYAHVFLCKEMSTLSSPTCLVPFSSPSHFHSPLKGVLFSLCKHYAKNKLSHARSHCIQCWEPDPANTSE